MDEPTSKSQKKRDALALQKLGVKLIELSLEKINALPLTPELQQAIVSAKTLRSHGAIRRQAQLIGKLMRRADGQAIADAYERLLMEERAQTYSFHQAEHWRARLIEEGKPALTEFINTHHPDDVQLLRQLIKKAVLEAQSEARTGAGRALFRYLRSCLS